MVRLKGKVPPNAKDAEMGFNSYMVRLKEQGDGSRVI